MSNSEGIRAEKSKATFRFECTVRADVTAPASKIWSLLTNPGDMTRWNSTLESIEGAIELGGVVKMRVPEAPGRTFKIKVTEFIPNQVMVWTDGNPVFFQGQRTYRLVPTDTGARFEMSEVFRGLMLPMIFGHLPDFGPIFERYAADLKREAERLA